MSRRPRGRALIINNKHFMNFPTRDGSEIDVEDLRTLFGAIHFQVEVQQNRSAQVTPLIIH